MCGRRTKKLRIEFENWFRQKKTGILQPGERVTTAWRRYKKVNRRG